MRFLFDSNTWQEIFGSIGKNKTRTIITIVGVLWEIIMYKYKKSSTLKTFGVWDYPKTFVFTIKLATW